MVLPLLNMTNCTSADGLGSVLQERCSLTRETVDVADIPTIVQFIFFGGRGCNEAPRGAALFICIFAGSWKF